MTISGKARPTISRRGVLRYGAVAGAAAAVSPTFADTAHASGLPRALPAPRPIPGGSQIPNGPLIHVFAPGPEGLTLPFTGVVLEGRDVEPGVITDFNGASAVAFHVGTATGSDGKQYNLETDIRAMEGDYVAVDGTRRRGLFVLIWIDLFEPGSGSQVHDLNAAITPSGLFWIVELPRDAFRISRDGRQATLKAQNVAVVDSFQFLGPVNIPASVSFSIRWEVIGGFQPRGRGSAVAPTDPAAFLGRLADARSTGSFSGVELGFSFRSNPRVSTDRGYAEVGTHRNGVFLT